MKKILIIILFLLPFVQISYAQGKHDRREANRRLEELEKIKLIETLNLDEETTLKFFSRRNAHRETMMELNRELKDKTDQIETAIKSEDQTELEGYIKEYLTLESKIVKERRAFFNSLSDLLNVRQLGKFIVFEKKFREEIRDILFRERRRFNKL